jgi:hypothetical protein
MAERLPCKTDGCTGSILPATAEKTGGFCMPCVQKVEKKERDEFIRNNRVETNPYENISDPVEIIKIYHTPRKHDPLVIWLPYPNPIEEVYQSLSQRDLERLVDYVVSMIGEGPCDDRDDQIDSIARELAAFTNADLSKIQSELLASNAIYPSMAFSSPSPEIRDDLLSRLHSDASNRNLILLALAWAGDESIAKLFHDWRKTPPVWVSALHVPPHEYAKDAGWEVDTNGQRRSLYLPECYPLISSDRGGKNSPVEVAVKAKEKCQWCGNDLTDLFSFDLTDERLDFIPHMGEKLTISTCIRCTCYGCFQFREVTSDGLSMWSKHNKKPDYLPDDLDEWEDLPERALVLADKQRSCSFACDQFLPVSFSQIGGLPTWIQDFSYPDCPTCNSGMMFVGQLACEDIEQYGEGIYYAFLCPKCSITATTYQQT